MLRSQKYSHGVLIIFLTKIVYFELYFPRNSDGVMPCFLINTLLKFVRFEKFN